MRARYLTSFVRALEVDCESSQVWEVQTPGKKLEAKSQAK